MSLQMIYGGAGSGKSRLLYDEIIKKSMENPGTNYIIVVPEQFTMSTQKELVRLHPARCISNIDVLSFGRLAFRILEETGRSDLRVLDDMGKNLILRKIAIEQKDKLKVLGANVDKLGYISEIKSVISEFTQYNIGPEELDKIIESKGNFGALGYKLEDISRIYKAFREEIKESCITSEEVLTILSQAIDHSKLLKGAVVAFDGFTGFTPVQYQVIDKLLMMASMVLVTVNLDQDYKAGQLIKEHELFNLSKTTIDKLCKMADKRSVTVNEFIQVKTNYRLKDNKPLSFLEDNIFRYKNARYQGQLNKELEIRACANPEKELEYIAYTINNLVREEGLRYKDFAIITGDVNTYARVGLKVMEKYNIPCFMDYKRDVLHNPFIESIRALLACIEDNYSYASIFRYLKSGAIKRDEEELFLLENYCIATGKRGHKTWNQEWVSHNLRYYSEEDMIIINQLRAAIANELEPVYQGLKGAKTTAGDKLKTLYQYMLDNNLQLYLKEMEEYFDKEGYAALAKEYSQIYKLVVDMMDQYMELLGQETMPLDEFIQIMDAGFAELRIGIIPPGQDCLVLGDITRTRLGDVKVLFFAGVNEGIIPSVGNGGGIISQTEREYLTKDFTLAPTLREKAFIQRFYLYLCLTKPNKRLIVTYSRVDLDGNGIRPSYLINTLTGMFGQEILKEETKEEIGLEQISTVNSALEYLTWHYQEACQGRSRALWQNLYSWYKNSPEYKEILDSIDEAAHSSYQEGQENLTKELAKELYGEALSNSVTRLELYTACAFAHFLQYGLRLEQREEYEISAADMGSIMHESLRIFTEEMIKNGHSWNTIPDQLLESMAEECVDAAAEEIFRPILQDGARNQYLVGRMKRLMKRSVWALSKQMKSGLFVQEQCEKPFKYIAGPEDGEIKAWVRGRIDRMDVFQDDNNLLVRILDYKTGQKEFDLADFYNGLSMQLVVYLDAAMRDKEREYKNSGKNIISAGVFYYVVDDPIVDGDAHMSQEDIELKLGEKLRLKGIYNTNANCLEAMDNTGESHSLVIPMSKNKDGSLKANKSALNSQQFEALREHLNKIIVDKASEILEGRAELDPYYKSDKEHGCLYCAYRAVCGFDQSIDGYKTKPCESLKDQDIWSRLLDGKEGLDA